MQSDFILQCILWALFLLSVVYGGILLWDYIKYKKTGKGLEEEQTGSSPLFFGTGLVAYFFDSLGIGSFAITTAFVKFFKLMDDRVIPGTLYVAYAIPTVLEAFVFLKEVRVDLTTLILLVFTSIIGAIFGARVVASFNRHQVRLYMGIALIAVAFIIFAGIVDWIPVGGEAIGLTGWRLALAMFFTAIIGALSTMGIGAFAPTMALLYALGMSPLVTFPIMMSASAFMMVLASPAFIRKQSYHHRFSVWATVGGCIGVLIAVTLVQSLPLQALKWLVIGVVLYTSIMMLRDARKPE